MSSAGETFFTSIGCMDGRVQEAVAKFGKEKFQVLFPDTITEAGLDGVVGQGHDQAVLDSIKKKVIISVDKHHSKGIVIHGHEDCAGNPVAKEVHIQNIKESMSRVREMLEFRELPIIGAYLTLYPHVLIEEIQE